VSLVAAVAALEVWALLGVGSARGAGGVAGVTLLVAGWSVGWSTTVADAAITVTVGAPAWQAVIGSSAAPATVAAARRWRIGA
jgi:hypothetical protein